MITNPQTDKIYYYAGSLKEPLEIYFTKKEDKIGFYFKSANNDFDLDWPMPLEFIFNTKYEAICAMIDNKEKEIEQLKELKRNTNN